MGQYYCGMKNMKNYEKTKEITRDEELRNSFQREDSENSGFTRASF